MTRTDNATTDARLMKALAHPLRHRILEELSDGEASPSKVASALGESLPNVSYHFKTLEKAGAIELVDTRVAGGTVEHVYRATARAFFDDEQWGSLPLPLRNRILETTVKRAFDHLVAAARKGGLDGEDIHVSWTKLDLDRRGYEEMVALLAQTLDQALEIQANAINRIAELGGDRLATERTELTIFHYRRA